MSFVESATLRVIDQSSAPLGKINAAIDKLMASANKLKSLRVQIRIEQPRNLDATVRSLDRLGQSVNRLNSTNLNGLSRAAGQISALSQALGRPISTQGLTGAINRLNSLNVGNLGNVTSQIQRLTQAIAAYNSAMGNTRGGNRFQPPRLPPVPPVPPVPPPAPRSGWGRNGFSPNASLVDRAQYRAVNKVEQSMVDGALGIDKARTYAGLLGLSKEDIAAGEKYAAKSGQKYKEMTRGDILSLYGEIGTNFKDPQEALKLMPDLQEVIRAQMLAGDTAKQAQDGLVQLVRGLGTLSKLTDDNGKLKMAVDGDGKPILDAAGRQVSEAGNVLDLYKRAKIIGGKDINPREFAQFAKYSKTAGQTMQGEALLLSMLAMPDMRGSSFGNSMNQMQKQLTGRATKEAQAEQAKAGLIQGGMERSTPSGPRKFMRTGTTDESMLRTNPFEWFYKNIMGVGLEPGKKSFLEQQGIDISKETKPEDVAKALGKIFSRDTAEQLGNLIANQRGELMTMKERAQRLNVTPERLQELVDGSLNSQLQQAGQQLASTLGDIAEKLKGAILPLLKGASEGLNQGGRAVDPGKGPESGASPLAVGVGAAAVAAGSGYAAYRAWRLWRGAGSPPPPPGGAPPASGSVLGRVIANPYARTAAGVALSAPDAIGAAKKGAYGSAAAEIGTGVAALFNIPAAVALAISKVWRSFEAAQAAENRETQAVTRALDAATHGTTDGMDDAEKAKAETLRKALQEAAETRGDALGDPNNTEKANAAKEAMTRALDVANDNQALIERMIRKPTSDEAAARESNDPGKPLFRWLHDLLFPPAHAAEQQAKAVESMMRHLDSFTRDPARMQAARDMQAEEDARRGFAPTPATATQTQPEAASPLTGFIEAFNAAVASIRSAFEGGAAALSAAAPAVAAAGEQAGASIQAGASGIGSSIQSALESGGASAAAQIGAALRDININVNNSGGGNTGGPGSTGTNAPAGAP